MIKKIFLLLLIIVCLIFAGCGLIRSEEPETATSKQIEITTASIIVEKEIKEKESKNTKKEIIAQKVEKTNEDLAHEVREGLWGDGPERYNALTNAGYDADTIQEIVDEQLREGISYNESIDELRYGTDYSSSSDTSNSTVSSEDEVTVNTNDVYGLGYQLYGISYLDTERTLKLISYEGYGYSPLSYYVACCCWVRATEGYWGYGNLYNAFGEIDGSYGEWMDGLGIADYAYDALLNCYQNPTYVKYCNGMAVPSNYIYYENGIYVWN